MEGVAEEKLVRFVETKKDLLHFMHDRRPGKKKKKFSIEKSSREKFILFICHLFSNSETLLLLLIH